MAVDDAKFDITVSGSDADLTRAAWIVQQIDTQQPAPAEYPIPGSTDVIDIFYLAHTPTQAGLNELVTSLRAVVNVPQVYSYSPARGVAVRIPAVQAPMVLWLAHQLDVATDDQSRWQPHEYAIPGSPNQVVKVVYLIHPMAQSGLNEMVTTMRTVADIRARSLPAAKPQGIAYRASTAQAQLGDWLFQQLDVLPDNQMRAQQHEYVLPGEAEGITRVYYLNSSNVNDVAQAIRSEAMPVRPRIFVCTEHRAVALRGTSDVIAIAIVGSSSNSDEEGESGSLRLLGGFQPAGPLPSSGQ